jgi:hypothetical protein
MPTEANEIAAIQVRDATGQTTYQVGPLPTAATIDEVVSRLLSETRQPTMDPDGRPLAYGVRTTREQRFLGGNERLGDVLEENDTLELMPTIDAGGN